MTACPLTVIGHVRTAYTTLADTPVQSSLARHVQGRVEVLPRFTAGLEGLAGFDHAWLVTWLGSAADGADGADVPLVQTPFLAQRAGLSVGLFAMRGPRRVNPLGLSLVRVLGVEDAVVRFAGVDVVDGTPVVDLKPYVTAFDRPDGGDPRCGWFDTVDLPPGATPSSLRPGASPA